MSRHGSGLAALTAAIIVLGGAAGAATSEGEGGDKAAIAATMMHYQDALNASSTPQAMALYTEDGVFMAPNSQSAVGKPAVREAYDNVFKRITLHVKFTVGEIVQMAPDWAFVRTNSAGTQTVNATHRQTAEANQELFVLHKDTDGQWRIARYAFSTTNPAAGE